MSIRSCDVRRYFEDILEQFVIQELLRDNSHDLGIRQLRETSITKQHAVVPKKPGLTLDRLLSCCEGLLIIRPDLFTNISVNRPQKWHDDQPVATDTARTRYFSLVPLIKPHADHL